MIHPKINHIEILTSKKLKMHKKIIIIILVLIFFSLFLNSFVKFGNIPTSKTIETLEIKVLDKSGQPIKNARLVDEGYYTEQSIQGSNYRLSYIKIFYSDDKGIIKIEPSIFSGLPPYARTVCVGAIGYDGIQIKDLDDTIEINAENDIIILSEVSTPIPTGGKGSYMYTYKQCEGPSANIESLEYEIKEKEFALKKYTTSNTIRKLLLDQYYMIFKLTGKKPNINLNYCAGFKEGMWDYNPYTKYTYCPGDIFVMNNLKFDGWGSSITECIPKSWNWRLTGDIKLDKFICTK